MKSLSSTDSLGPTTEEGSQGNDSVFNTEFQSILEGLDEEGCVEEMGLLSGKKRRLRLNQVKALEKSFQVENKLEPERKVKLAQELGFQPRQVAVWFQNRRARGKTKQLEKDFGVLKASYDSLKLEYENLQQENQSILEEINALKSMLEEENIHKDCDYAVKEEVMVTDNSDKATEVDLKSVQVQGKEVDFEVSDQLNNTGMAATVNLTTFFTNFRDGSSDDSDSSAVLNEDNNSPKAAAISWCHASDELLIQSHQFMPSAMMNCFPYGSISSSDTKFVFGDATNSCYQPEVVKIEEHNFSGEYEPCNFFSDPSLQWYCRDQWG